MRRHSHLARLPSGRRTRIDRVTGLGTQRVLLRDLRRGISRTGAEPAALMLFDLEGFKAYNDTFGRQAGNALLALLAGALREAVTPPAIPYRLRGDEFGVLAPAVLRHSVAAAAERALASQGEGFAIGVASAVVVVPDEARDPMAALRLADQRVLAARGALPPGGDPDPVTEQAVAVGRRLGLPEAELRDLRRAAELHDVGKQAIPERILAKPGPLAEAERGLVDRHPLVGERLLGADPRLAGAARIVRHTHERWDGTGYPDGLAGEEIPLGARIIAVCDAYDAMVRERPYTVSFAPEVALQELRRCAGTQFDPLVVRAFAAVAR